MNRVIGYAGVTIRTNRIEESLHFYCEGLGLKLIEKKEEKAVVSTPEGVYIEFIKGEYQENTSGYTHLCLETFDCERTFERGLQYGATSSRNEDPTNWQGLHMAFLRAPGGEEVELWYVEKDGKSHEEIVDNQYIRNFVHMAITVNDKQADNDFYAALGITPKVDWEWGCSMIFENRHELELFTKGEKLTNQNGMTEMSLYTDQVEEVYQTAMQNGAISLEEPHEQAGEVVAAIHSVCGEVVRLTTLKQREKPVSRTLLS